MRKSLISLPIYRCLDESVRANDDVEKTKSDTLLYYSNMLIPHKKDECRMKSLVIIIILIYMTSNLFRDFISIRYFIHHYRLYYYILILKTNTHITFNIAKIEHIAVV